MECFNVEGLLRSDAAVEKAGAFDDDAVVRRLSASCRPASTPGETESFPRLLWRYLATAAVMSSLSESLSPSSEEEARWALTSLISPLLLLTAETPPLPYTAVRVEVGGGGDRDKLRL